MNIKKLCCHYDWYCWGVFTEHVHAFRWTCAHAPLFVFLPRDLWLFYNPWTALACASLQLRFVFSFLHTFHTNAKFFHNCVVFQISTIFSDSVDIFLTGYVIFQTHAIFLGNYICIIYTYIYIYIYTWLYPVITGDAYQPLIVLSHTYTHIYIYIYIYCCIAFKL